MSHVSLSIEGMSCHHCVAAVRGALASVDGVRVESVTVGAAEVDLDPSRVPIVTLLEAIADAGYTADDITPR